SKRHDEATGEGTFLETTIYVARQFGAPPEDLWPYQSANRKLPTGVTWAELDRAAGAYKAQLTQVQDLDGVLGALDKKMTVLVAANATESWFSESAARTGSIKPASKDPLRGMTVITLVAYDPASGRFKFANNWGSEWGDKGFGYFDRANAKTI